MKVKELVSRLELQVVSGANGIDREIAGGYCGDLLSDVMGNAPLGCVWMTVQGHQNVMNVAQMREMAAVVLANGILPDEETRRRADDFAIPLILWEGTSYDLAVRLAGTGF